MRMDPLEPIMSSYCEHSERRDAPLSLDCQNRVPYDSRMAWHEQKVHARKGSKVRRSVTRAHLPALILGGVLSLSAFAPALAASDAEVEELRRAVLELQGQNRDLLRRLNTLETETAGQRRRQTASQRNASAPRPTAPEEQTPEQAQVRPSVPAAPKESRPRRLTSPEAQASEQAQVRLPPPITPTERQPRQTPSTEALEERVRELEISKAAQENATRSIIRDSLTTLGANINQYVALGGALDVRLGRFREFSGPWQEFTELNTAELDFDVKLSDWLFGSLIVSHDQGTSPLFTTSQGFSQGVDRLNVDRATITVGDPQLFPLYFRGGRDVLHFGTSTGVARLDTLSLTGPLSTEAFETRQDFVSIGFAFPTPELAPLPPPVVIPPVQPLVVNPLVNSAAQWMGYRQPVVPVQPLVAVRPPPFSPPLYGSISLFQGDRELAPKRGVGQNVNASVGYFTRGSCGRNYEDLRGSWLCPWSLDFHVDYVSSVFDSNFLRNAYRSFLTSIGTIPGTAAALKVSFGPFSLIGEYNTAIRTANLVDGAGRRVNLQPSAWQLSLGYQFDWNPWVEKVGEQGSFLSVAYSGTRDMAGVTDTVTGTAERVGFLPQSRLALTAGEWVLPNLRFATEVALNWDYARRDGGTGKTGLGLLSSLLLVF
jgi:hypothetical protein